jgi:AcrR family transcriptional regulator
VSAPVRGTPRDWEPGAPRRGRPRSEAVERAIIEGVLQLLEEGSTLAELSIERIAKVAGVGKATIYRRWRGKEALVLDVLAVLEDATAPRLGGSVRDDLVALLESVRQRGVSKRDSAVLRLVMTEVMRHPELSRSYHDRFIEPRRRLLRQVLQRGIDEGELRDDLDLDLLHDLIVGPMLLRTVLHESAPLEEDLPARMVDAVLAGVRRR